MYTLNKEVTCCGLQSYFVEIRPKKDSQLTIDKISEFFYSMNLFSSSSPVVVQTPPDSIRVQVVGADLSEMVAHIHNAVGKHAFISRIDIGPELVVYDYVHLK